MTSYIIAYDLDEPGQQYDCINSKLEEFESHWHMQGSVWIVVTDWTAAQIRDDLLPCLDKGDTLFVCELGRAAAWHGLSQQGSAWLKEVL